MQQETTSLPTPLDYATPDARRSPQRRWLMAVFATGLIVLEGAQPRFTPPGWPTNMDYALMLLLPIGAIIMAVTTSLPGWSLGLYGLFGTCTFLLLQLGDTRLQFRLKTPSEIHIFVANWCAFVAGAWALCRVAIVLRRFRRTA